jgi:hypothetical protein
MALNGQVVGLALYAGAGSPMTAEAGMQMMMSLADTIRSDSAAAASAARPAKQ